MYRTKEEISELEYQALKEGKYGRAGYLLGMYHRLEDRNKDKPPFEQMESIYIQE